jgi:GNAT superfamily N-acetyltransferase
MSTAYSIEPLARGHQRGGFDCGEPALNEFLARFARQNDERGLGRTYVAVPRGERRVVGYYTLSAGSVQFAEVPEHLRLRFPRYPIPVAHLGRLATCRSVRGQGLGGILLIDALKRSLRVADELGVVAMEVWAKSESARTFYMKYGCMALEDDPLHLYLPLETARRALGL